jgi:hypothetical protein
MLPPKEFRTIKQPKGSKVCGACVAAMATGRTLEEVEAIVPKTPLPDGTYYYLTCDIMAYLGRCGIYTGLVFEVNQTPPEGGIRFTCDETAASFCGYVIVRSKVYKHAEHVVFWDGEHVRDPSWCCGETTKLSDYHVIEFIPLTYIDDTAEREPSELIELAETTQPEGAADDR